MKHSKTFKSVKKSKGGLNLDYIVTVDKLDSEVPAGYNHSGARFRVVGKYVKPCGKVIYNSTVRWFKSVNEAMIGYSKLIKEKTKEFEYITKS